MGTISRLSLRKTSLTPKTKAMKEHKQGEVITLENGVRLQVIAHEGCDKCYFSKWYPVRCYGYNCNGGCREDKTYINYQQIK